MNVFVFDPHREACQIWQEMASQYALQVQIFQTVDRLGGLAGEADILVIDQAIVLHSFSTTVASLGRQHPRLVIVATGSALRVDDAVDLMRDGAAMVFSKPLSRGRIAESLPGLMRRAEVTQELHREHELLQGMFSKLTSREKDVLNYILIGTSNKDTAQLLNVSVRTIESRRAKVYRKLAAGSVAELVRKIDRLKTLGKELGVQPQLKSLEVNPINRSRPLDERPLSPQTNEKLTVGQASGTPLPKGGVARSSYFDCSRPNSPR